MPFTCPHHQTELIERPGYTPEQRFCGTWYECGQCHYTVLVESDERKQLHEAAEKDRE